MADPKVLPTMNPVFRSMVAKVFENATKAIRKADPKDQWWHEFLNGFTSYVVWAIQNPEDRLLFIRTITECWGMRFEAVQIPSDACICKEDDSWPDPKCPQHAGWTSRPH